MTNRLNGRAVMAARAMTVWLCVSFGPELAAHDLGGHHGPTYEVTAATRPADIERKLQLSVVDDESGKPTAARFSLVIDGKPYVPPALGSHGLRFVSIHQGKKQQFVGCYAQGTGEVDVPLPPHGRQGVVLLAKGFEYLPEEIPFQISGTVVRVTARLRRWIDLRAEGWLPAEEHLHYDRLDPAHDKDWLTMLAGDDLTHANFLVVKGANLPGVWAQQFAFGKAGEAADGERWIRPGEEYRDTSQGHINLLGIDEMIPPISTGGLGEPKVVYHYPAFYDVFRRAREVGGIGGPAHGTALGRHPTGIVETVLGAVDFFEIANTHLYKVDVWYLLMNCGYVTAPAAGTDLPNYPFREPWQPLLGETRMYVRLGSERNFESWKNAVCRGRVFVTSGPLISFTVNGAGPGDTVRLPHGGGEVRLEAELAAPRPPESFELISSGRALVAEVQKRLDGPIHRWTIRHRLRITQSCWLAARGEGVLKQALAEHAGIRQNTIAHTGAVRVLVGDQPIHSPRDAELLIRTLREQQEYYRSGGKYERPEHRERVIGLFDAAIAELDRKR